jgi:CRISPR-associated protein Cas2
MIFVIAYDIKDPKRLRRIYKLMEGNGFHVQYSLYFCELNKGQLAKLKTKIKNIMATEDSILVMNLGDKDTFETRIETIGKIEIPTFNTMIF